MIPVFVRCGLQTMLLLGAPRLVYMNGELIKIRSLDEAYGYYPNASETWLIVKSEFLAMANKVELE